MCEVQFTAEMTDTFAGEANYSWVTRETFSVPEDASDLLIVRRAKAALGLTGVRCYRQAFGDQIVLDPVGTCIRVFIDYNDASCLGS